MSVAMASKTADGMTMTSELLRSSGSGFTPKGPAWKLTMPNGSITVRFTWNYWVEGSTLEDLVDRYEHIELRVVAAIAAVVGSQWDFPGEPLEVQMID